VLLSGLVGVSDYKDLIVWRLADELRREVYRLTKSGEASRDFRFTGQLRNAVAGVPSNLAEGFRRYSALDFARFVTYAFAGVGEVSDRLEDGVARELWAWADLETAQRLIRRLNAGLPRLLKYLRSPGAVARSRHRPAATGGQQRDG
jgi:four helix bundle protein